MFGEISGIRKSRNAEEGAQKFFQTPNLIVSHFKREGEKNQVYQLTGEKNILSNLLIGSTAIHCYDFLGIRTRANDTNLDSIEAHHALEHLEKKDLYQEIEKLANQTVDVEIELSKIALDYENQILDALINGIDIYNEEFVQRFKELLEDNLIESLNKYPLVFFYDHIGELTGYAVQVKEKILKENAGLKATSIDLDVDLIKDRSPDKYLELATLTQMVAEMQRIFEFKSIKDLKTETFSLRKIITRILNFRFEYYPISIRALKAFKKATDFKLLLFEKFKAANTSPIDYNEFEKSILIIIQEELCKHAKKSSHEFVNFLENILDISFADVADILNRYGINDIQLFCEIQNFDLKQFNTDNQMFQITKTDLQQFMKSPNVFDKVEEELNKVKYQHLCPMEKNIDELLKSKDERELKYVQDACNAALVNYDDFRKLYHKKMILQLSYQKKYPTKWLQAYALLFEMQDILSNLSKFIYFTFFSRICRQTARILESFVKSKEDKNLILLGLKRVMTLEGTDQWVLVKIEELIIERLMQRQKEFATIFNADNNAVLVNAFILARYLDIRLEDGEKILKEDPSPIYEDIIDISLPNDLISPISYIIALDLLNRMKESMEIKKLKYEQNVEAKSTKTEQKKQEVKRDQESSTLNFIEKKITSTIMVIRNGAINPAGLYWSEKDQKMAMDNIKMHSELKNRLICTECGEDVSQNSCSTHSNNKKTATVLDLFSQYYGFSLNRIKELWPTLKIPSYEEIHAEVLDWMNEIMKRRLRTDITDANADQIIEGERVQIAQKIAQAIGEYLDKAIYKKFKETLKT